MTGYNRTVGIPTFAKVQVERPKKIKVRSLDEINNKRRTKKKTKKILPAAVKNPAEA